MQIRTNLEVLVHDEFEDLANAKLDSKLHEVDLYGVTPAVAHLSSVEWSHSS